MYIAFPVVVCYNCNKIILLLVRDMTKKDLRKRQAELESKGLYDVDMNEEHRTFDALPIDGDFNYLPVKFSERFRRCWLLTVVKIFGPVITWFSLGARVKGRKNLRALKGKGAISVCNHVHTLDTLLIKNALGSFRVFNTGSYYLIKRGWAGRIFKSGGFLPVGTTYADMKKLQDAIGVLTARGKIVNFYPEHALWPRYEKLRPFKQGAFHYAVKFDVPVLPLFIEFRETKLRKLFHMQKKLILHILPAVYAEKEGTPREQTRKLGEEVFAAMSEAGKSYYGRPVAYNEQEETLFSQECACTQDAKAEDRAEKAPQKKSPCSDTADSEIGQEATENT